MPDRSRKCRSSYPNQMAAQIVQEATDEALPETAPIETRRRKSPAAVTLGGLKGGKAGVRRLTPEQRKEIARKAARTRWTKNTG